MSRTAGSRRLLWLGFVCVLSVSCASTVGGRSPEVSLSQRLAASGVDQESLVDPLELSPEMKTWAHEQVRGGYTEGQKLDLLMAALTDKEGLSVKYERDFTGTAREVFESGEANCLSFTTLFVALAREVEVNAYYLNVLRSSRYAQEGDLVVRWQHVTAGWDRGAERKVLEFGFIPDENYRNAVKLSDTAALAMFYSNRGAEALLAGEPSAARDWLEVAVLIDPSWLHGWLNLGVVRRRMGDFDGAEAAYRTGIELDPNHLQLYANLAALLQTRGREDGVGELLRLLDRRSNRNPFLYRSLGDRALREGQIEDAGRFYRRALRLDAKDADSHAAMGIWELADDNPERARSRLKRAERLDPSSERAAELRTRLQERGELSAASPEGLVRSERDLSSWRVFA